MLDRLRAAWGWFAGGLVEALLIASARLRPAPRLRVDLGGEEAAVLDAGGRRLGRLRFDGGPAFEPPGLGRVLAGAAVDLVVPPSWLLRRELDPVAAASRPFLDAFVRHHIERVTPWRVGDTHYRILEAPLADDPSRLSVAVAVVPRKLVASPLAALAPVGPRALRLRASDDEEGRRALPLGAGDARRTAALRRGLAWALAAALLAVVALVGWLQWQAAAVGDEIAEQDRVIEERKAVLARERRGSDTSGGAAAKLRALQDGRAAALSVVDALSAALPDSAHLTALSIDGDRITIAGVSSDPSGLVPALETSGDFAAVSFGAATAKAQTGAGDTFTLEMRALPPRSDRAAPPAASPRAAP